MGLAQRLEQLRAGLGLVQKQDIQLAARGLGVAPREVRLGDDCAAIPEGEGYLLLAAEGVWPLLVETEPWFAGWCGVLVNVSDIYAMGGRPLAVVDALWSQHPSHGQQVWAGMQQAAQTFEVPIVGGHTNCHSPYGALSVAILGRAKALLTSFDARPGDTLLLATDFRGRPHPQHPFWDAATQADPQRLRGDLALLPELAESGLCDAAKDVSMGGILGTLLMLLETSNCGATVDLNAVPCPKGMGLDLWLRCFPSYGFLLSVRPRQVAAVQARFWQRGLVCDAIATLDPGHRLQVTDGTETVCFWDLAQHPLTGFGPRGA